MYNLRDVAIISGLTDRTLRNYLRQGILKGEKDAGAWRFSEEQVELFLNNEYVKPAIQAKQNAVLFDFLTNDTALGNTACIILHLKEEKSSAVATFFCEAVNKRQGLTMKFDKAKGKNKVILIGAEDTVYDILQEYHSTRPLF